MASLLPPSAHRTKHQTAAVKLANKMFYKLRYLIRTEKKKKKEEDLYTYYLWNIYLF